MASFTDIIPQFTPYVQQLPVEAMVAVGMEKQKRYDEGVQKIQQSIDKIAGLQVDKDVEKAYLQSKLNQLGNDLTFVAAGDFSNYQIVNSVDGMAKQIAYDPNIQTAISSSAKRRKEYEFMEEARKKGELNPSNEYVFKFKDSSWVNNTELGQAYNAKYTPFYDTDKHIREAFKGLEKDGISVDQIFQTDGNGKIMMSNGEPVLSPYMKRLKKEGIFPEKVKATIEQAFSDGRVNQQLSIDGQYTYRNYDEETLSKKVLQDKNVVMNQYENEFIELSLKKSFGADVKDEMESLIEKMKAADKSYNDLYNVAFDNPNSVRGLLYKDDVKRRWTSIYTNIKTEEQVLDNPAYKMRFEEEKELQRRREKAFDQKLDVQKFERDEYWKKKNYDLDVQKAINEANKTKPGKGGGVTGTGYGDATKGIENPYATDKDNQAIILAENKYNTAADNYNYNRDEFIWRTIYNTDDNNAKAQKIVDEGRANGKDITIQQARSIMIDRAAARDKQNPYEFRRKWFDEASKRVDNPNNTLNSDKSVMSLYNSTKKAKKIWENEKANKDERDQAELDALDRIGASEDFKTLKDETIDYRGQKVKITKQDQIDIAAYIAGKESVFYGLDSSDNELQAANYAKRRLDKKGLGDIAERYLQINRMYSTSSGPIDFGVGLVSETASGIVDLFKGGGTDDYGLDKKIRTLVKSVKEKEYTKAYASKASVARFQYNIAPNKTFNLMSGDTETDRALRTDLGAIASTFQTGDENQNLASDDEFESFIGDIKNEDATFTITSEVDEAGNPVTAVVSIDKDGKPSGRMVLNPDQSTKLGYDVNMMFETNEVTAMKSIMNSRGGKTCFGDPYDIDTYSVGDNAYYDLHAGDFANVKNKNITVKGNVLEQDGLYFGYIYVNNGNSKPKVKSLPPSDNLSTLNTTMQTVVNDQFIQSILKE
jgi:hypothetical protein